MYIDCMRDNLTSNFAATVSAAALTRNFGRFKEMAQRGPVAVTSHGRESVVLLSAEEYARLKALDDRQALYAHELPDDLLGALEEATPPAASKAFNDELKPK